MKNGCQLQVELYVDGEDDIFDQMVFDDVFEALEFMKELSLQNTLTHGERLNHFEVQEICEGSSSGRAIGLPPFRDR